MITYSLKIMIRKHFKHIKKIYEVFILIIKIEGVDNKVLKQIELVVSLFDFISKINKYLLPLVKDSLRKDFSPKTFKVPI